MFSTSLLKHLLHFCFVLFSEHSQYLFYSLWQQPLRVEWPLFLAPGTKIITKEEEKQKGMLLLELFLPLGKSAKRPHCLGS